MLLLLTIVAALATVGGSAAVVLWAPVWCWIVLGAVWIAALVWLGSVIKEALFEYWREQDGWH